MIKKGFRVIKGNYISIWQKILDVYLHGNHLITLVKRDSDAKWKLGYIHCGEVACKERVIELINNKLKLISEKRKCQIYSNYRAD